MRDRYNHSSPNSAHPESAVAGALGCQLGGSAVYFGEQVVKPTIGDKLKILDKEDIIDSIRLMYTSSILGLLVGIIILVLV